MTMQNFDIDGIILSMCNFVLFANEYGLAGSGFNILDSRQYACHGTAQHSVQ